MDKPKAKKKETLTTEFEFPQSLDETAILAWLRSEKKTGHFSVYLHRGGKQRIVFSCPEEVKIDP